MAPEAGSAPGPVRAGQQRRRRLHRRPPPRRGRLHGRPRTSWGIPASCLAMRPWRPRHGGRRRTPGRHRRSHPVRPRHRCAVRRRPRSRPRGRRGVGHRTGERVASAGPRRRRAERRSTAIPARSAASPCSATETVTFVALKPGHLLQPGRSIAGPSTSPRSAPAPEALAAGFARSGPAMRRNGPGLWREAAAPPRPRTSHKYTRGHALVLSGPAYRTGAARLGGPGGAAGRRRPRHPGLAGLRSGRERRALTAIMLRACDSADDLDDLLVDERLNVVLAGPGLGVGEATRDLVAVAAAAGRGLVLDADALTSFKGQAAALAALIGGGRCASGADTARGRVRAACSRARPAADRRTRQARARPPGRRPGRGGRGPEGRRHGRRRARWPGRDQRSRHALSRHRRFGRRARPASSPGFLPRAWRPSRPPPRRSGCTAMPGCRYGPGLIAEDLPEMMPAVLGASLGA